MKTNAVHRLKTLLAHKVDEVWKPGVRGFHNATGALILAQNTARILFQLRSATSAEPNTYGQFGGSLDGNEEVTNGLRREILEETGYDGPMSIRPLTPYRDAKKGFVYYNNLAIIPFEFTPQINDESSGYVWAEYGQWPDPLHPGLASSLKDKPSLATIEHYVRKYKK